MRKRPAIVIAILAIGTLAVLGAQSAASRPVRISTDLAPARREAAAATPTT